MMSSEHTQLPSIGNMLRITFEKWYDDNIPRHAAVLAFYALFAFAPILLLCVEVLGLLYGRDVAEATVQKQVTSFVSSAETASWVQTLLDNILPSSANWWVTAGFIIVLIFGASSFFGELKVVLNLIWGVPFSQDVGFGQLVLHRLQAVLMVLVSSLLIFLGLVITNWLSTTTDWATVYLNIGSGYATWSYLILIFVLLTLVFALIYKFVPDVVIEWQAVWIGAAATALLLSITRLLISLYFSYSHTTTMFGAASALVVILLWVYYSAQIFFLGAEFTYVYSSRDGVRESNDEKEENKELSALRDLSRHKPAGPIELEVVNLEPATVASDRLLLKKNPPEKSSRFSAIYQRASKPLTLFRSASKESPNSLSTDPPLTDPPNTDPPTTDPPTTDPPTTDPPTSNPPTADPPTSNPPNTDTLANIQTSANTFQSRVYRFFSLPIRIIRPVREVVVAVGIIGAISLAAMAGIPFWKKRNTKADSLDPGAE